MILKICRYSVMEAPRGPKIAPRRPNMVSKRPQDGPRRPQERPKRASGRLKMAQERVPRRAQEGSKSGLRTNLAQRPPRDTPGTLPGPPWESPGTPPGPLRDSPGPILEAISGPIWGAGAKNCPKNYHRDSQDASRRATGGHIRSMYVCMYVCM